MHRLNLALVAAVAAVLLGSAPAAADGWLPNAADATWEYTWTDSVYNTTPTKEKVTVCAAGRAGCTQGTSADGSSFQLAWTTVGEGNAPAAPASAGTVSFQEESLGLVNTDWQSNPPPPNFPILCATLTSCGNSLASTYYNLIWGTRAPTLFEPILKGTSWSTTGGAQNDIASTSDYLGTESITVPAFPMPVLAAKVQSQITQAGALGDPYGSGIRTVWWVYGVGPVKIEFDHAGGTGAPVTTAVLDTTNQTPQTPPPDANYFPLRVGLKGSYKWTNTKYLKQGEVESYSIGQVANGSAQLTVASDVGPIKVNGAYGFTTRLDGVTNLYGTTKSSSLAKLPPLGPRSLPADKRRHFFTPFDLMIYGFNPVIPAYPAPGNSWSGGTSGRDFAIYGVTGKAVVLGVQTVKVPAGTFKALAVRTTLKQAGFPFGSGTRTSWFASGRGLVKLVFRHGDGSVSTVELVK
ncbi:MAG TPA: hypothetical protein VII51_00970 [Gaiellaceae bacterium]